MTLKEIKNKNGEAALWGKTIYIIGYLYYTKS